MAHDYEVECLVRTFTFGTYTIVKTWVQAKNKSEAADKASKAYAFGPIRVLGVRRL